MGVRNLPKVLTRQRPGRESNLVSAIHKSDALPVSHQSTLSTVPYSNLITTYLVSFPKYSQISVETASFSFPTCILRSL